MTNKEKLKYPWDSFPEDFSTWECCVEEYLTLKESGKLSRSLLTHKDNDGVYTVYYDGERLFITTDKLSLATFLQGYDMAIQKSNEK